MSNFDKFQYTASGSCLFPVTFLNTQSATEGSGQVIRILQYDEKRQPKTMTGTAQDLTTQRKTNQFLEKQLQERTEQLEATNEELAAINEENIVTNEELSDLNNMLQQSNVNLQQFAYMASHDLQDPLRKIQAFSDVLINRYGESLGEGMTYLYLMKGGCATNFGTD